MAAAIELWAMARLGGEVCWRKSTHGSPMGCTWLPNAVRFGPQPRFPERSQRAAQPGAFAALQARAAAVPEPPANYTCPKLGTEFGPGSMLENPMINNTACDSPALAAIAHLSVVVNHCKHSPNEVWGRKPADHGASGHTGGVPPPRAQT